MLKAPFPTTLLLVLDGWGHREATEHNAIAQANTPNWDKLWQNCPHSLLRTSGEALGLPAGQMGNSEVGHLHIGAGRLVLQDLPRINQAIAQGEFASNAVLCSTVEQVKQNQATLHLIGLVSDGGVHSHQNHLHALIDLCADQGLTAVKIHAILDGRDAPPQSAGSYLEKLEAHCQQRQCGQIASICGRYTAMDRDQRWERTQAAFDLYTKGQGNAAETALAGLQASYGAGKNDEFVEPTLINDSFVPIAEQDSVILFNFRADRMRQLANALTNHDTPLSSAPSLGHAITMTAYPGCGDCMPAFVSTPPDMSLGETIAKLDLPQLRIAETEKYAHVTFFFNGGVEQPFELEERFMVPSPKVVTYDLQPEMSAFELTEKLVAAILSQAYALIVCNFANADMVGHSGNLPATVKAVETIDLCLGMITAGLDVIGGQALITADHGNAEMLFNDATGQAHTAHTGEPVPLVYYGNQSLALSDGALYDIAPTILDLMGLSAPSQMTGQQLNHQGG